MITSTAIRTDQPTSTDEEIFADPVAYLASHGIVSILVADNTLPVAA